MLCFKTGWNSAAASLALRIRRLKWLAREPMGNNFRPNIYVHFTENLDGFFYDGYGFGKNPRCRISRLRRELIAHSRPTSKAPVVRFRAAGFSDTLLARTERKKRPRGKRSSPKTNS